MPDRKTRERLGPVIARVREQAAEFVAREADVRRGDPGGVHRMRVAVRRLRGCLKSFRPAFDDHATRHLGRELQWIGGLLGAERDAEVIAERIARSVAELPGSSAIGPMPETADRPDTHAVVVEAMDPRRYRSLVEDLAAFAISPPLANRHRKKTWLEQRLVEEIVHVEKLVAMADRADGDDRSRRLHEVRKSAKQLRYAAETLASAYGEKARRIAAAYEEIQTILGEHHDAVVTAQVIADERLGATVSVRDAFNLGILYAREEAHATLAADEFTRSWARTNRLVRDHWPHR